jgi:lycopene cyclase domain-containing protein
VIEIERLHYVGVLVACVIVTLPLEFAFGARVWRRPARTARSIAPVALVFLVWDLWATHRGTWFFDETQTLGLVVPGGLPVEELAFFVVIPACALLTLESVRNIERNDTPVQRWWAQTRWARA